MLPACYRNGSDIFVGPVCGSIQSAQVWRQACSISDMLTRFSATQLQMTVRRTLLSRLNGISCCSCLWLRQPECCGGQHCGVTLRNPSNGGAPATAAVATRADSDLCPRELERWVPAIHSDNTMTASASRHSSAHDTCLRALVCFCACIVRDAGWARRCPREPIGESTDESGSAPGPLPSPASHSGGQAQAGRARPGSQSSDFGRIKQQAAEAGKPSSSLL